MPKRTTIKHLTSLKFDASEYLALREDSPFAKNLEFAFPVRDLLIPGRRHPEGIATFCFFAGSGFLDLGFEMEGFQTAFINEFNPEFIAAHRYTRDQLDLDLPAYGQSTASVDAFLSGENAEQLSAMVHQARQGALVGFIGGPPCPDFSVGGKNRGREGENGKLTASYFDLITIHRPDWFLFENVKGLWSTKRHKAFYEENIKKVLNLGYTVAEKLVNAIEYGAPQDRDRVIAIGFSPDICTRLGIPKGQRLSEDVFPWKSYQKYERKQVFALPWPKSQPFGSQQPTLPNSIPADLTVSYWFQRNSVKTHPNAKHCFRPRAGLARFESVDEGDDSRKSYKRLHRLRYSPTACYGNNEVHLHPTEARRISVAEALAIQTLPKQFALPPEMTLSAMFKTIGNGVPFVAAKSLARMIRDYIEKAI